VVRKDAAIKKFGDLEGKILGVPKAGQGYQLLVANQQTQKAASKDAKAFFKEIKFSDSVEDTLDDLVDGTLQAAAVDRTSLDAYKRRKPARFDQLRALMHSGQMTPTVIAYFDQKLDAKTAERFRDGLLNANKKEKGRTLLTYFKLTGFGTPPADFDKVLEETRKTYPDRSREGAE
jgi:ABC-type phosphate/phosphonate transport system substrate-binding protein